jgi:VanZ family protein
MLKSRRLWALVAYVALIFLASSIPSLTAPGPNFAASDKVAHLIEYSLLGALLYRVGAGRLGRSRWMEFLFLVTVGASVGAFDEVYQGLVPGRSMSIYDWYADITGTALGILLMRAIYRRRSPRTAGG